ALNTMTGGQTLKIIATDLGFVKDISGFCQQTGNVLVSSSEQRHEHVFVIRKS
ncbi:MAG: sulfurtransferase TusA family protein, partial [Gammaproteobacteria bacterium]|nr:sulfurtransferase TusA family protein [Gammaproteobacteria bacterium]